MARILVTGKSGFIAGQLLGRIAACGEHSAEAISVRDDNWRGTELSEYDCVVHTAGIAHVDYRSEMRDEYFRVNRDLTLEVAQAAKDAGVGRFIFLSSIIVYGPAAPAGQTRFITGDTPPAPENAYGQSKLEAEWGLARLADEKFRVAVLRLPMVYGEGCRGNYALIKKYARLLPVFPGLCGMRSAISVEGLCGYILERCADDGQGIYFPQDDDYATTPGMLAAIRAGQGKKTRTVSLFDPLIRLAGGTGIMRRVFGGIAYDRALTHTELTGKIERN